MQTIFGKNHKKKMLELYSKIKSSLFVQKYPANKLKKFFIMINFFYNWQYLKLFIQFKRSQNKISVNNLLLDDLYIYLN